MQPARYGRAFSIAGSYGYAPGGCCSGRAVVDREADAVADAIADADGNGDADEYADPDGYGDAADNYR